ncbi:hypothetical protein QVD17_30476 [Tagetes erecta]|uniref:Uncharacterized protein n=1 Tax=Tagetes erecta TaxID=13708 RepID=A0AAD8K1L4_TARER|nr:hypothetical protein QVD17_30476 [Tagetes erecta]
MYPRFLQLIFNEAHPAIKENGVAGGTFETDDMNVASYRKMSMGVIEDVVLFDYMRDIENNEEDISVEYYHISQDDPFDPLDLDDLLDAQNSDDSEDDDDSNKEGSDDHDSDNNDVGPNHI